MAEPSFLPSRAELQRAFSEGPGGDRWAEYLKGSLVNGSNGLEYVRPPVFEVLNREYVGALGGYLSGRVSELVNHGGRQVRLLEVGAGSGRLSKFLHDELKHSAHGTFELLATDSNRGRIPPLYPVEHLDYEQALREVQPDIVLSSWMPYEEDWTAAFRETPSVSEYILIGDPEVAGDEGRTWGSKEGFERIEHPQLRALQVCRTDSVALGSSRQRWHGHSSTVSFCRLASTHHDLVGAWGARRQTG